MYQMVPTSKLLPVSYLPEQIVFNWDEISMRGDVGMSRRLLKFSGGSVDDYATFSAAVTSPSC